MARPLATAIAAVERTRRAGTMVRRLQDLCYNRTPPQAAADLNRAVRVAVADASLAERVCLELKPDLPPVQGTPLDLERLAGALLRGAVGPGQGTVNVQTG